MIPIFFYLTDQSTVVSKDCSYYKKVNLSLSIYQYSLPGRGGGGCTGSLVNGGVSEFDEEGLEV